MNILKYIFLFLALVYQAVSIKAQSPDDAIIRPVLSSYMMEIGSSHLTDTYLSPLKYSGWHGAFRYERLQAMKFNPERWVMRLALGIGIDRTENPTRNSTMTGALLSASWDMCHRWMLPSGFSIGAGGITGIDLGGLYNSRNGNNPASATASWQVGATGYAAWNGSLWKLPVSLRYRTSIPCTGVFFAPDYGELYYEIWLGDRTGLVHPIWWGDWFRWDNMLTADLQFGSTSLRIGYSGRMETWRVNGLTSRTFNHALIIGITTEWISLHPKRRSLPQDARIIPALY